MKVIRSLFCLFFGVILLALYSCGSKDKISIGGEILNPGNLKVVAFYEGGRKLDSVYLSDQNKFRFERAATQPRLLSIEIGKNKYPVIVSPGEGLKFTVDLQNNPENYKVEGSVLSTTLKVFAPIRQKKEMVEDSLQSEFVKLIANKTEPEVDNLRAEYLSKYKDALKFYTVKAVEFASQNPDLAGFYVMSTLDADVAEQELIVYGEKINNQFLDNKMVTDFKVEIEKLKKLAIGQIAPEIVAYSPTNSMVKLSDYRGKYTLVDFWASWCVPCRKENPNIVRLYNLYKSKGFDVLGVSLDSNPGSWMRAIEEDRLTWANISDLKAWSSNLIVDYKIKAIPSSVIVDPEGKILAKNLRGKELERFLESLLN